MSDIRQEAIKKLAEIRAGYLALETEAGPTTYIPFRVVINPVNNDDRRAVEFLVRDFNGFITQTVLNFDGETRAVPLIRCLIRADFATEFQRQVDARPTKPSLDGLRAAATQALIKAITANPDGSRADLETIETELRQAEQDALAHLDPS